MSARQHSSRSAPAPRHPPPPPHPSFLTPALSPSDYRTDWPTVREISRYLPPRRAAFSRFRRRLTQVPGIRPRHRFGSPGEAIDPDSSRRKRLGNPSIRCCAKCSHGSVETATAPARRTPWSVLNPEQTLEFLSRGRNLQPDGLYLGGCHGAARQVMRLELDFTAQVLGHLFEGLNKVIADARSLGTRPAPLKPSDLQTLSMQIGGGICGDIPALCLAPPFVSFPTS